MNNQTRRDWLITIGQTTAGLGIVSNWDLSAAPVENGLPPGLYLPSTDHLSHALMSSERFHPVPADCPTDYVQPRNGPVQPQFFTSSDFRLVERLTHLILGEEDESISNEVAEWVDQRVASSLAVRHAVAQLQPLHHLLALAYFGPSRLPGEQAIDGPAICREGLEWIGSAAQTQNGSDFLSLGLERQVKILETIDSSRDDRSENAGTRFLNFLKSEVTLGFYTSRAGLKELDFKGNAFYARSPGCSSKGSSAVPLARK